MLGINVCGVAGQSTPGKAYEDGVFNADLILMSGDMPPRELLKAVANKTEFLAGNSASVVAEISSVTITSLYNHETQERHFKKTPVDALEFTNAIDGEVKWAVLAFHTESGVSVGGLGFIDSVGDWDDHNANVTLKDLIVVKDAKNIFKDMNFTIRDKSTYEVNPAGITA